LADAGKKPDFRRLLRQNALGLASVRIIGYGRVTFEYKDYADGNKTKILTLEATEFIRRFLLHILPSGFVRIRQFGFLANRARRKKLRSAAYCLARLLRRRPLSPSTVARSKSKTIDYALRARLAT